MKRSRLEYFLGVAVASATMTSIPLAAAPANNASAPAPPPLPAIRALKLEPPSLHLKNGRDQRRVLVLGMTEGETFLDLTSQAKFETGSAIVELDAQGYLRG